MANPPGIGTQLCTSSLVLICIRLAFGLASSHLHLFYWDNAINGYPRYLAHPFIGQIYMLGLAHWCSQSIQYFSGRQENWALLSVVNGAEMSGKRTCLVTFIFLPIIRELFSVLSAVHKPMVCLCRFSCFWVEILGYETMCSCVVSVAFIGVVHSIVMQQLHRHHCLRAKTVFPVFETHLWSTF